MRDYVCLRSFLILLLVLGAHALPLAAQDRIVDAASVEHPASRVTAPPLPITKTLRAPALTVLPRAEVDVWEQVDAIGRWNAEHGPPVKTGFLRPLEKPYEVDLSSEGATSDSRAVFERAADHLAWATRIEVERAHRIRLHLADVRLPPGTELWVHDREGHFTRFGLELLRAEGDLWTPSVAGDALHLQIRIPEVPRPGAVARFRIDAVVQTFQLDAEGYPVLDASVPGKGGGSCLRDAACFDDDDLGNIDLYKEAVAHLRFVESGSVFICSGAMMNDTDPSGFIPYMLTANHCFSTQSVANTLEAYFDFIPSACGGGAPSLATLPRVVGATLLATSPNTDSSFVRLSGNPSGSTAYLGWRTARVQAGTDLFRISHPMGLSQAFSRASAENPTGTCSSRPTSRYTYAVPNLGGTFGGSSGAPHVDSDLRVRGQLLGGCGPNPEDGCDARNYEVDGRFSEFFGAIATYLDPGTTPPPPPPPPPASCQPSDTVLCLNDERFRVEGTWRDFNDNTGVFHAVPFTDDAGLAWFFNASNIELLVKVLRGCNVNGNYWVFAAATTNVEYTMRVTDTATGTVKTYFNRLGSAPPAITDTSAFATCP